MAYRSLYLHFECGPLLYGGRAVADLKADCLATLQKSRLVEPQGTGRPRPLRALRALVDAILRTFSPLF
jgi:cardiolipin synthase